MWRLTVYSADWGEIVEPIQRSLQVAPLPPDSLVSLNGIKQSK